MSAWSLQKLDGEIWFAARIAERSGGKFCCPIFTGATDVATRAERCRVAIFEHLLETERVVRSKPDTFTTCFERLYGEPLVTEKHQLDLGVTA